MPHTPEIPKPVSKIERGYIKNELSNSLYATFRGQPETEIPAGETRGPLTGDLDKLRYGLTQYDYQRFNGEGAFVYVRPDSVWYPIISGAGGTTITIHSHVATVTYQAPPPP